MRNIIGGNLLAALTLTTMPGELQVGLGSADITPPLGSPMAGYYHERGADGSATTTAATR